MSIKLHDDCIFFHPRNSMSLENYSDPGAIFPRFVAKSARIYWPLVIVGSTLVGLALHGRNADILGVIFTAGMFVVPGILFYTEVSRKCHPDQLRFWRGATLGLKLFYIWGFADASILISKLIAAHYPHWSMFWIWMRVAVVAYEISMVAVWRWRIRDTFKSETGFWRSVVLTTDFFQVLVIAVIPASLFVGPPIFPIWNTIWPPCEVLVAGVGVASICVWLASAVDFLHTKSGELSLSVDLANLGLVAVSVGGALVLVISSQRNIPSSVIWILIPTTSIAALLPTAFAACAMAFRRVVKGGGRLLAYAMALYGTMFLCYAVFSLTLTRPTAPPSYFTNFFAALSMGFILLLPTTEGINTPLGLDRLSPHQQLRKRSFVPVVMAASVAFLLIFAYR
ncbi:MAG: hypothetical protein HKL80_06770, partial [Acidimicrobiales bacterium]|nr:hypothetical protein [Acidimicrobiales bacterium]